MNKTLFRMKTCLVAAALVVPLTVSGLASAADYSHKYDSCMDNSGGVTAAMLQCASAELVVQDARLNYNYKKLMNILSPSAGNHLRQTQRQWIKDKESRTKKLRSSGGSLNVVRASSLYLEMTADRADELEMMLEHY